MADINLTVGQEKFASISLIDDVTNGLITSASFSNISISNSHPQLILVEPNSVSPTNSVRAQGVSAGVGSVVISVDCSYTDAGDNQPKTETLSITKTFEVIGTPHGAHLVINFP